MARLNLGSLFFTLRAETKGLDKAEKKVKKSTGNMRKSFSRLATGIAAVLSFEVARRSQVIAETMVLLDVRLKAVSDTTQQFVRNQQQLLKIADTTGQVFGDLVVLFEKIKLASKDIGATNDQILVLTDSLNKLGVIGGSSVTEIKFSMRQLGQSFAAGIIRAEEFNSIVENTPAIARAIAEGLGIGVGEMRKMVIEGRLLSEDVFNALLSQQDKINERFALIPRTSAMAWQAVQNQASQALKIISQEIDSTEGISGAFDRLADSILPFTTNVLRGAQVVQALWQITIAKIDAGLLNLGLAVNQWLAKVKSAFFGLPLLVERAFETAIQNIQEAMNVLIEGIPQRIRDIGGIELIDVEDNKARVAEIEAELVKLMQDQGLLTEEQHTRALEIIQEEKEAKIAAAQEELVADLMAIETRSNAEKAAGEEELSTIDPGEVKGSVIFDEDAFQDLLAKFGDQTAQILSAERKRQEEISKIVGLGLKERAELEKRSAILLQRDMNKLAMMRIASVASTMDQVIALIGEGNAKQSALGRIALGISKGLALAQAAIALQQNIAEASKIGFPQNIPMIAAAISQGLSIIMTLKGVSTNPGREHGGPAAGGFATPVTENGLPEMFTNAAGKSFLIAPPGGGQVTTMDEMGGRGRLNVTIINNGDPLDAIVDFVSRDELEIRLERTREDAVNIVNTSLAAGEGPTFDALSRSTEQNFRTGR